MIHEKSSIRLLFFSRVVYHTFESRRRDITSSKVEKAGKGIERLKRVTDLSKSDSELVLLWTLLLN